MIKNVLDNCSLKSEKLILLPNMENKETGTKSFIINGNFRKNEHSRVKNSKDIVNFGCT